jgi:hypothetical protein
MCLTARIYVNDDIEDKPHIPSDVPMYWPDDEDEWNSLRQDYEFRPTFPPEFSKNLDKPPHQLGLESLVMRLLSLQ